ncbi:tail fiber domain-containing protein [Rhodocytophaga rosea]|uniref:Tail fiber domain-containing protein n=1 Tax=Rhodocytophaga rosea TaxID=2704465 RepID=A0A6C0GK79_9BACT|nr:tail fiber domain-containing protein [Rhodocytophaga rosea]QHT68481.1 tail fiber domain-containing protein [Rhodocytophaga rosea]
MKIFIIRYSLLLLFLLSVSISFAQTNVILGPGTKNTGSQNVFVGNSAGGSNISGFNNTFLGNVAGFKNTIGNRNVFIGDGTGFSNTSGSSNTFLGNNAGQNNQTGSQNVFVGHLSGVANKDGKNNVFLGFKAGFVNDIGFQNIFIGAGAGEQNTSGRNNVFLGFQSGFNADISSDNTFLGNFSGFNTTTGSLNVFLGESAGERNTVGSDNVFIGVQAGVSNTTGNINTFVGRFTGAVNSTGNENSFFGSEAGRNNRSGSKNVYLGNFAGEGAFDGSIGNGNAYIGYEAGKGNTSGNDNVFLGNQAGRGNTSGSNNTFIGKEAGSNHKTGKGNTYIGSFAKGASDNLSNASAIGFRSQVTASNALVLGSINGVNGATATAKVGIGTTSPAFQLHVNGSAAKSGSSTWSVASDKRLKQDIKPFKEGLETIKQINPVWFKYNGKAGLPTEKKYVGVIAQEMQKIAGYTVNTFTYQDEQGKKEEYLDYDANALTYMLVNAVKEQQQQLDKKEEQVNALRQENQEIKKELALIKKLLLNQPTSPVGKVDNHTNGEVSMAAILYQSIPNPSDGPVTIPYFIPDEVHSAQIIVVDKAGQQIHNFQLPGKGNGQVSFSTNDLAAGIYVYQLVIDGSQTDSKKIVIVK